MRVLLTIDLLSEIFVVRQQNPVLCIRFLNDMIIVQSAGFIVHRENFMILRA